MLWQEHNQIMTWQYVKNIHRYDGEGSWVGKMTQVLGSLDANIVWQGQLARVHDIQGEFDPPSTQTHKHRAFFYKHSKRDDATSFVFITFTVQGSFGERKPLFLQECPDNIHTHIHTKRRGGKEGALSPNRFILLVRGIKPVLTSSSLL